MWKKLQRRSSKQEGIQESRLLGACCDIKDIDQIGSCFNKDVFDPHGYDKSDFYDEIVVAASGLPSIPASSTDGVGRDGRQSKKSKWD